MISTGIRRGIVIPAAALLAFVIWHSRSSSPDISREQQLELFRAKADRIEGVADTDGNGELDGLEANDLLRTVGETGLDLSQYGGVRLTVEKMDPLLPPVGGYSTRAGFYLYLDELLADQYLLSQGGSDTR